MATFEDWFNRSEEWQVNFNRMFVRLLQFSYSHVPKAEGILVIMAYDLCLFDGLTQAQAALAEVKKWAEENDLDPEDNGDVARMAKRFYDHSARADRALNSSAQMRFRTP